MEVDEVAASAEPPRPSRVRSVERAARLLQAVAAAHAADASAASLAERCGLNRATAWRLLSTLEAHALVRCDRSTGRWSVGPALVTLAERVGAQMLVRAAHAVLEQLSASSGETAALAIPGQEGLTYVDEVTPAAVVAATWLGRTVPLHATSTGKAFLASLPEDEVDRLAGGPLRRFTPTTVIDRGALRKQLAEARIRGYSVCRGEYDSAAWGVSAPVLDNRDRPRAVLSIWAPAGRVTERHFAVLGSLVRSAASSLHVSVP